MKANLANKTPWPSANGTRASQEIPLSTMRPSQLISSFLLINDAKASFSSFCSFSCRRWIIKHDPQSMCRKELLSLASPTNQDVGGRLLLALQEDA
jgi:hypothetical protein